VQRITDIRFHNAVATSVSKCIYFIEKVRILEISKLSLNNSKHQNIWDISAVSTAAWVKMSSIQ